MKSKRNLAGLLILALTTLGLVFASKIAVIADPYLDYLKSTSSPEILVEKTLEVLVETREKGKWCGRTRGDKLVFFSGSEGYRGKLVNVKITRTSPWSLTGIPV